MIESQSCRLDASFHPFSASILVVFPTHIAIDCHWLTPCPSYIISFNDQSSISHCDHKRLHKDLLELTCAFFLFILYSRSADNNRKDRQGSPSTMDESVGNLPILEHYLDNLFEIMQLPAYTTPLESFIDEQCIYFAGDDENAHEHKKIHTQYLELAESAFTEQLEMRDIFPLDFLSICEEWSQSCSLRQLDLALLQELIKYHDFQVFKAMMYARNATLDDEAAGHRPEQSPATLEMKETESQTRQATQEQSVLQSAVCHTRTVHQTQQLQEAAPRKLKSSNQTVLPCKQSPPAPQASLDNLQSGMMLMQPKLNPIEQKTATTRPGFHLIQTLADTLKQSF